MDKIEMTSSSKKVVEFHDDVAAAVKKQGGVQEHELVGMTSVLSVLLGELVANMFRADGVDTDTMIRNIVSDVKRGYEQHLEIMSAVSNVVFEEEAPSEEGEQEVLLEEDKDKVSQVKQIARKIDDLVFEGEEMISPDKMMVALSAMSSILGQTIGNYVMGNEMPVGEMLEIISDAIKCAATGHIEHVQGVKPVPDVTFCAPNKDSKWSTFEEEE